MISNKRAVRIQWGDCDPAGIVFYPRYFAFFDASTEMLIERALGMTKYEYMKAYDMAGHPLVNTQSRFLLPTRFGDDVSIESTVVEIRRSSFDIRHRLFKQDALAVEGLETRVWSRRDPETGLLQGAAVPPAVVERMTHG